MPTTKKAGRPRLDRERYGYTPCVEPLLRARMQAYAAEHGISLHSWMEAVIARAHSFDGRYLVQVPLPAEDEVLRALAHRSDVGDLGQLRESAAPLHLKLDLALAKQVNIRCLELGIPYTQYLRALLRVGAGYPADPALWPRQDVLDLPGVAS